MKHQNVNNIFSFTVYIYIVNSNYNNTLLLVTFYKPTGGCTPSI